MKRKFIHCVVKVLLCFSLLCTAVLADTGSVFPDVPDDAEYTEAVDALFMMGIFTGDENGNFNPYSTITRAESAAIICRLMGVENEAKEMTRQVFTDVPSSHWAVGYVAKAAELGIIDGYGNGEFGPGNPVTYEQMIKMLVCAWGYAESATERGGYPFGHLSVGNELGITENVSIISGIGASRKDVAVLCYNILVVAPYDYIIEGDE